MRLDKFVCKSTLLSRKEAVEVIQAGKVSVNGNVIDIVETQAHENNEITFLGERLALRPFRYILLNKPADMLCSNVDGDYPSILRLINIDNPHELHIAGRLDADTTGLVLITDDGRWSFNVFNPKYHCYKTYRVGLKRSVLDVVTAKIDQQLVQRFSEGLTLQGEDKPTLPAKIELVNEREVLLTISEGRYHQVKRMFAAVGNKVIALHREQVGHIYCDVEIGNWRHLTHEEVNGFTVLEYEQPSEYR